MQTCYLSTLGLKRAEKRGIVEFLSVATFEKKFWRDEQGQTLLEFAFSVLTLTLLIFAVFEISLMMYTYVTLGDAVQEGVRYAVVHGATSSNCSGPGCGDSTGTNIVAAVDSVANVSFHNISRMTVTPSWPDGDAQPGHRVKVLLSYSYIPFIKIPGDWAPTMQINAEGYIVF